ncbi:hypothetical protein ACIPJS_38220 [Streptomyces sp. NPDC086783]|uniref:hypothetical protein n=1 Tax=Streptomyces sp. NPDC086783 TaxID=3365758 RepID=UPI0037FE57D6
MTVMRLGWSSWQLDEWGGVMPGISGESEYGPHSPDYGLSYEPDPFADPEPIDDPDAWEGDVNGDPIEAGWEQAFRDGHITREQFQQRRRSQ